MCSITVATGSASLLHTQSARARTQSRETYLKILLKTLGPAPVQNGANVGSVDAHAKGHWQQSHGVKGGYQQIIIIVIIMIIMIVIIIINNNSSNNIIIIIIIIIIFTTLLQLTRCNNNIHTAFCEL